MKINDNEIKYSAHSKVCLTIYLFQFAKIDDDSFKKS